MKTRADTFSPLPIFFLLFLLFAGCAGQTGAPAAPVEAFTTRTAAIDFQLLQSELRRGVSTKEDVLRSFGPPSGTGGLHMPAPYGAQNAWFYEKIDIMTQGQAIDVHQDVLLIFFKGEILDGWFWFSDGRR
jgi:hypothetical protein